MTISFLPLWANVIFIVALVVLCLLALSNKINLNNLALSDKIDLKKKVVTTSRSAYYIIATIGITALAVFFLVLEPLNLKADCNAMLYGFIIIIIVFVGLFTAGMSYEEYNGKLICIITGIIAIICITFTTLAFANITYAVIWLLCLGLFGFIGYLLFQSSSAKKK